MKAEVLIQRVKTVLTAPLHFDQPRDIDGSNQSLLTVIIFVDQTAFTLFLFIFSFASSLLSQLQP